MRACTYERETLISSVAWFTIRPSPGDRTAQEVWTCRSVPRRNVLRLHEQVCGSEGLCRLQRKVANFKAEGEEKGATPPLEFFLPTLSLA